MLKTIFNNVPAPYLRFRKTAYALAALTTIIPLAIAFAPAAKALAVSFGYLAAPEAPSSVLPSTMETSLAGAIWCLGYFTYVYLAASYAHPYLMPAKTPK